MNADERFQRLIGSEDAAPELRAQAVRGGLFALGAEGFEVIIRLGTIMILARLLIPGDFGLIAMVTAVTSIAERFKDIGLSIATIQRKVITHAQVSTLFWINVGVGLGLVVLITGLAYPITRFYGEPQLFFVTVAIASGFFWGGLTVQHQALLRRQMKFAQLAGIQVASGVLSGALAITLAVEGFGIWSLVVREVSRGIFMAVGTWLSFRWLPGAPSRNTGIRSMLALGANVTVFNVVAFVGQSIDQILIGRLFGAVPLGLYRQGINLVLGPISQLSYPINSIAESTLSRLQSDPEGYRRYCIRIVGILALATMPIAAFLALMANEIVLVALGAKWLDATEFFRILAVAAFIRPAMSAPGFVMVTQGLSRRYLWWGLWSTLFLISCVAIGTLWGPIGVAYAQAVSSYLLFVPVVYWGLKGTPVGLREFATSVSRPIAASLLMVLALFGLKFGVPAEFSPLQVLSIGATAAVPIFLGFMFLLPGGRSELAQAVSYLVTLIRPRPKSHALRHEEHPATASIHRVGGGKDDRPALVHAEAPLVSIVINNYNYGQYVGTAIQSALRQTYDRVEVVVVDDGSTDNSRDVIEEFADRIHVIMKKNGGQASAFNVGIARAGGEFIILLDADDYLYPNAVEDGLRFIRKGYSRIFFQLDAVDAIGHRVTHLDAKIPYIDFDGDALEAAARGMRFPATVTSANFFPSDSLKAILPIPEDSWRICADNFVAIQTSVLGPVLSVRRKIGAYRFHGNNGWMAQKCLYTDRKRLGAYTRSYLQGNRLIAMNCERLGIRCEVPTLGDYFWSLHLLSSARRIGADCAPGDVPNRRSLYGACLRYLFVGGGKPFHRMINTFYLLLILTLPNLLSNRIIETYCSLKDM